MKRQGYKFAVTWIGDNDSPADGHESENIQLYISVALVSDLFGKTTEQVAADVAKYRAKQLEALP